MIVEMVVGEVCKYPALKSKSGDSVLVNGMRANLHESIFTTRLHHTAQHLIDLQLVACGMS